MSDEPPIGRITKVGFGLSDSEFAQKVSVTPITKSTLKSHKLPTDEGPDDPSLGSISRHVPCRTCGHTFPECIGHFGVVHLEKPVCHPEFIKQQIFVHKLCCVNCGKFMFPIPTCKPDDEYKVWNNFANGMNEKFFKILKTFKGIARLRELYKICHKKVMSCGFPNEELMDTNNVMEVELTGRGTPAHVPPNATGAAQYYTAEQISTMKKNVQGKKNPKSHSFCC